ncbi:unnamed protein product [Spirodela intermedia]|uniref:Uncharacterized protein n=1 Tax=Spirodela intermedia TaxID=51605 RepID=A0A7I8J4P1_SPIIN|nr:unnamed protein product [Spirodela intermedia]CAA6665030.1 unnamed protein product [Spirodela intermedia]
MHYKPGPDLEEDSRNPLLDISLTDSTELWLIHILSYSFVFMMQLQPDDFDGKEISLNLHQDGELASVETSSGKSYDVVSFAAQEPDATVFLGMERRPSKPGSSKEGGDAIYGTSHDTLTSMDSMGPGSVDHSQQSKRKRRKGGVGPGHPRTKSPSATAKFIGDEPIDGEVVADGNGLTGKLVFSPAIHSNAHR